MRCVLGDNNILDISKAYRIELGTGWNVAPGILHAPGSILTYEPQRASDVSIFFQSLVEGRSNGRDTLEKDIPKDKYYDYEYLIDILDWEKNVDPNFKENNFLTPVCVKDEELMKEEGYLEKWVVYGCNDFCAKELTVFPGRAVTIKDDGAYGFIMLQGHGRVENVKVDTPALIRFYDLTSDEMFVTKERAAIGVTIVNNSEHDNIVMLKHFGPDNKEAEYLVG